MLSLDVRIRILNKSYLKVSAKLFEAYYSGPRVYSKDGRKKQNKIKEHKFKLTKATSENKSASDLFGDPHETGNE